MPTFLSKEKREILQDQHKKERDKRVCDRIKAILLYDEGWIYSQIAHVLLLSDEAVRQHVSDYQALHKLKPENGGSESKLDAQQTLKLLEHLQKTTYLYTKDIVLYVEVTFGTKYSTAGMTSWLKTNNFSYKKPAVVPGKANREAQELWIKEYEKLKNDLPDNETICFIDGVHPTHNTKSTYGWIKKGERKEIPTNTGRQRLNLSGALDINLGKVLIKEDITLNAASTISFLKKLESAYPNANKVHVFCDNAKYYKNREVMNHLITSKIKMHFLPPYSPNLNPIERLWKLMNEKVLYNKYHEKFSTFKNSIIDFLESLYDPPDNILEVIKKRVTDNFRAMGSRLTNATD